jgi:orotate phosphoribosyltransferase
MSLTVSTAISHEQVRREARRDHVCATAWSVINDEKIHRVGHFDLGNGYCGDEYFNPHPIVDNPTNIHRFSQCLIDLNVDAGDAEIFAGPLTGGAFLAHSMAGIQSSQLPVGQQKYFVPFHPAGDMYELRAHYKALVKGKRVWLVDDVLRRGNTIAWCAALIEEAGGRLVATSVILHNMDGVRIKDPALKGIAHSYIKAFRAKSWKRTECKHCAAGEPFTQF